MQLWLELLKLFGSGVVAASAAQILVWWREARNDRAVLGRDARYLAIRLAVILEEFAFACASLLDDSKTARRSGGYLGQRSTRLPELKPYPTDADWKTLKPSLLDRALTFINEVHVAAEELNSWPRVAESDDVSDHCEKYAGLLGLRALETARDFRRTYKLRGLPTETLTYDPQPLLQEYRNKALAFTR